MGNKAYVPMFKPFSLTLAAREDHATMQGFLVTIDPDKAIASINELQVNYAIDLATGKSLGGMEDFDVFNREVIDATTWDPTIDLQGRKLITNKGRKPSYIGMSGGLPLVSVDGQIMQVTQGGQIGVIGQFMQYTPDNPNAEILYLIS